MYYFIGETRQLKINAANSFVRQAEAIYNENLSAYVRLVLRRPFAKIIVSLVQIPILSCLVNFR